MVAPATAATSVVFLSADTVYAKEAPAKTVDLKAVRESVMDLIEKDEQKRGDGSEYCLGLVLLCEVGSEF